MPLQSRSGWLLSFLCHHFSTARVIGLRTFAQGKVDMARARANAGFATEEAVEGNDTTLVTITLEAFKTEKQEVQDLGNKLPIGLFHPETGERLQEFTLHPYRTKFDRQLGSLLNAPKVKLGTVLGNFLPVMIDPLTAMSSATSLKPCISALRS